MPQVGSCEVRTDQVGLLEIGFSKIRIFQVGVTEIGTRQVSTRQIDVGEYRPLQINLTKLLSVKDTNTRASEFLFLLVLFCQPSEA